MAVSLAIPMMGAGTTPTYSITIENATDGQTYKAYKIFDVTYDADRTAYAYTISSSSPWYSVVSAYASNENNGLTLTATKADPTVFNVSVVTSKFSAAAFAEFLRTKVTSTPPELPEVSDTGTALEYSDGKATAKVYSLGYYFVTSSAGSLCNLTTTNPSASIYDKNVITFDKTVDDIDVEIGQTVNYTITGAVPNVVGYTKYVYKVSDTLSDGLTLNEDVKVKIGGSEISLDVITDDETELGDRQIRYNDKGFELYFDMASETNSSLVTDAKIEITYSATVNKNAVRGEAGNPNTAKLEYSNNPADATKTDSITDIEIVYTVDIEILKYETGDETKLLSGAEFILYRVKKDNTSAETTTEYYKYDNDSNKVTWEVAQNNATEYTTGADGKVTFNGIQANSEDEAYSYEYYLRETAAPKGYNLLESDVQVNITREQKSDVLNGDNALNDTKQSTITISEPAAEQGGTDVPITDGVVKVANSSGSELPETGGIGTTIFYAVGGIMMVIAVVLLVTKKKMSNKK